MADRNGKDWSDKHWVVWEKEMAQMWEKDEWKKEAWKKDWNQSEWNGSAKDSDRRDWKYYSFSASFSASAKDSDREWKIPPWRKSSANHASSASDAYYWRSANDRFSTKYYTTRGEDYSGRHADRGGDYSSRHSERECEHSGRYGERGGDYSGRHMDLCMGNPVGIPQKFMDDSDSDDDWRVSSEIAKVKSETRRCEDRENGNEPSPLKDENKLILLSSLPDGHVQMVRQTCQVIAYCLRPDGWTFLSNILYSMEMLDFNIVKFVENFCPSVDVKLRIWGEDLDKLLEMEQKRIEKNHPLLIYQDQDEVDEMQRRFKNFCERKTLLLVKGKKMKMVGDDGKILGKMLERRENISKLGDSGDRILGDSGGKYSSDSFSTCGDGSASSSAIGGEDLNEIQNESKIGSSENDPKIESKIDTQEKKQKKKEENKLRKAANEKILSETLTLSYLVNRKVERLCVYPILRYKEKKLADIGYMHTDSRGQIAQVIYSDNEEMVKYIIDRIRGITFYLMKILFARRPTLIQEKALQFGPPKGRSSQGHSHQLEENTEREKEILNLGSELGMDEEELEHLKKEDKEICLLQRRKLVKTRKVTDEIFELDETFIRNLLESEGISLRLILAKLHKTMGLKIGLEGLVYMMRTFLNWKPKFIDSKMDHTSKEMYESYYDRITNTKKKDDAYNHSVSFDRAYYAAFDNYRVSSSPEDWRLVPANLLKYFPFLTEFPINLKLFKVSFYTRIRNIAKKYNMELIDGTKVLLGGTTKVGRMLKSSENYTEAKEVGGVKDEAHESPKKSKTSAEILRAKEIELNALLKCPHHPLEIRVKNGKHYIPKENADDGHDDPIVATIDPAVGNTCLDLIDRTLGTVVEGEAGEERSQGPSPVLSPGLSPRNASNPLAHRSESKSKSALKQVSKGEFRSPSKSARIAGGSEVSSRNGLQFSELSEGGRPTDGSNPTVFDVDGNPIVNVDTSAEHHHSVITRSVEHLSDSQALGESLGQVGETLGQNYDSYAPFENRCPTRDTYYDAATKDLGLTKDSALNVSNGVDGNGGYVSQVWNHFSTINLPQVIGFTPLSELPSYDAAMLLQSVTIPTTHGFGTQSVADVTSPVSAIKPDSERSTARDEAVPSATAPTNRDGDAPQVILPRVKVTVTLNALEDAIPCELLHEMVPGLVKRKEKEKELDMLDIEDDCMEIAKEEVERLVFSHANQLKAKKKAALAAGMSPADKEFPGRTFGKSEFQSPTNKVKPFPFAKIGTALSQGKGQGSQDGGFASDYISTCGTSNGEGKINGRYGVNRSSEGKYDDYDGKLGKHGKDSYGKEHYNKGQSMSSDGMKGGNKGSTYDWNEYDKSDSYLSPTRHGKGSGKDGLKLPWEKDKVVDWKQQSRNEKNGEQESWSPKRAEWEKWYATSKAENGSSDYFTKGKWDVSTAGQNWDASSKWDGSKSGNWDVSGKYDQSRSPSRRDSQNPSRSPSVSGLQDKYIGTAYDLHKFVQEGNGFLETNPKFMFTGVCQYLLFSTQGQEILQKSKGKGAHLRLIERIEGMSTRFDDNNYQWEQVKLDEPTRKKIVSKGPSYVNYASYVAASGGKGRTIEPRGMGIKGAKIVLTELPQKKSSSKGLPLSSSPKGVALSSYKDQSPYKESLVDSRPGNITVTKSSIGGSKDTNYSAFNPPPGFTEDVDADLGYSPIQARGDSYSVYYIVGKGKGKCGPYTTGNSTEALKKKEIGDSMKGKVSSLAKVHEAKGKKFGSVDQTNRYIPIKPPHDVKAQRSYETNENWKSCFQELYEPSKKAEDKPPSRQKSSVAPTLTPVATPYDSKTPAAATATSEEIPTTADSTLTGSGKGAIIEGGLLVKEGFSILKGLELQKTADPSFGGMDLRQAFDHYHDMRLKAKGMIMKGKILSGKGGYAGALDSSAAASFDPYTKGFLQAKGFLEIDDSIGKGDRILDIPGITAVGVAKCDMTTDTIPGSTTLAKASTIGTVPSGEALHRPPSTPPAPALGAALGAVGSVPGPPGMPIVDADNGSGAITSPLNPITVGQAEAEPAFKSIGNPANDAIAYANASNTSGKTGDQRFESWYLAMKGKIMSKDKKGIKGKGEVYSALKGLEISRITKAKGHAAAHTNAVFHMGKGSSEGEEAFKPHHNEQEAGAIENRITPVAGNGVIKRVANVANADGNDGGTPASAAIPVVPSGRNGDIGEGIQISADNPYANFDPFTQRPANPFFEFDPELDRDESELDHDPDNTSPMEAFLNLAKEKSRDYFDDYLHGHDFYGHDLINYKHDEKQFDEDPDCVYSDQYGEYKEGRCISTKDRRERRSKERGTNCGSKNVVSKTAASNNAVGSACVSKVAISKNAISKTAISCISKTSHISFYQEPESDSVSATINDNKQTGITASANSMSELNGNGVHSSVDGVNASGGNGINSSGDGMIRTTDASHHQTHGSHGSDGNGMISSTVSLTGVSIGSHTGFATADLEAALNAEMPDRNDLEIYGEMVYGKMDANGEIDANGDKYGEIDANGDIYGEIDANGDIYEEIDANGDKYGEMDPLEFEHELATDLAFNEWLAGTSWTGYNDIGNVVGNGIKDAAAVAEMQTLAECVARTKSGAIASKKTAILSAKAKDWNQWSSAIDWNESANGWNESANDWNESAIDWNESAIDWNESAIDWSESAIDWNNWNDWPEEDWSEWKGVWNEWMTGETAEDWSGYGIDDWTGVQSPYDTTVLPETAMPQTGMEHIMAMSVAMSAEVNLPLSKDDASTFSRNSSLRIDSHSPIVVGKQNSPIVVGQHPITVGEQSPIVVGRAGKSPIVVGGQSDQSDLQAAMQQAAVEMDYDESMRSPSNRSKQRMEIQRDKKYTGGSRYDIGNEGKGGRSWNRDGNTQGGGYPNGSKPHEADSGKKKRLGEGTMPFSASRLFGEGETMAERLAGNKRLKSIQGGEGAKNCKKTPQNLTNPSQRRKVPDESVIAKTRARITAELTKKVQEAQLEAKLKKVEIKKQKKREQKKRSRLRKLYTEKYGRDLASDEEIDSKDFESKDLEEMDDDLDDLLNDTLNETLEVDGDDLRSLNYDKISDDLAKMAKIFLGDRFQGLDEIGGGTNGLLLQENKSLKDDEECTEKWKKSNSELEAKPFDARRSSGKGGKKGLGKKGKGIGDEDSAKDLLKWEAKGRKVKGGVSRFDKSDLCSTNHPGPSASGAHHRSGVEEDKTISDGKKR